MVTFSYIIFVKTLKYTIMKKTFKLLASLTLGLMVASSQNGLEEVINESAVQDELATTRAEIETPVEEEIIEEYPVGPTISGPLIISNTYSKVYSVTSPPTSTHTVWTISNPSLFNIIDEDDEQYIIKLTNTTSTADVTITASFYDSNSNVISQSQIYVGINGPHANHCSLRVVRSSDGLEVYPTHNAYMDPYSYYYAYFSSSSAPYGMTLDWQYTYANDDDGSTNYSSYFQTDANGYVLLSLYGKMSGSSIWKKLMGVTLY